jgi:uncharacterized protein (TIGR03086 family)
MNQRLPEAREGGMGGIVEDHRQACAGLTEVAREADGRWGSPSPCPEWDARGIVEHVIGFHDVLVLRPLDAKPKRPKDNPVERWTVTVDALFIALSQPGVLDDKDSLIGYLTTEVLVHTWDLSKAIGATVTLDRRLCQLGLDRVLAGGGQLTRDMFEPAVPVPEGASVQDRLVGAFGRDPAWKAPS